VDKCPKHRVELLEAGEDSAKAVEPTEQALDFVAATIHNAILFPDSHPVALRGNDGRKTQIKRQLPSFIPLAGTIHQQTGGVIGRPVPTIAACDLPGHRGRVQARAKILVTVRSSAATR
jgi:hypothetical protein